MILCNVETYKKRIQICKKCEHFRKWSQQCKLCGCFMFLKGRLLNQSCPINKWNNPVSSEWNDNV